MSEEKLKECPFPSCGGAAELGEDHGIYNCHCVDCGVMSPEGSKEYVLNFWNARQSSEAKTVDVEILIDRVEALEAATTSRPLWSDKRHTLEVMLSESREELAGIRNTLNQATSEKD
jgi:hypothetical protein